MSTAVMCGDATFDLWGMKFRIGVGRVSVATPSAAEHHGASLDSASMHLPEMNC